MSRNWLAANESSEVYARLANAAMEIKELRAEVERLQGIIANVALAIGADEYTTAGDVALEGKG